MSPPRLLPRPRPVPAPPLPGPCTIQGSCTLPCSCTLPSSSTSLPHASCHTLVPRCSCLLPCRFPLSDACTPRILYLLRRLHPPRCMPPLRLLSLPCSYTLRLLSHPRPLSSCSHSQALVPGLLSPPRLLYPPPGSSPIPGSITCQCRGTLPLQGSYPFQTLTSSQAPSPSQAPGPSHDLAPSLVPVPCHIHVRIELSSSRLLTPPTPTLMSSPRLVYPPGLLPHPRPM